MTVAVRSPRSTVTVPVAARPVFVDLPADPAAPAELRLVDALALAVEIRAAGAAAFRVHDVRPQG